MGKSVTVLLSTYNGSRYLVEQIESVLNQRNIDLKLLIRDDGSEDSTLKIIEEYKKKDDRISSIEGTNVGPTRSFLELIKESIKYGTDYYAFCDQDDVWDEDKLSVAISHLEKLNPETPNCYYSNLRIVDEKLSFVRLAHNRSMQQKSKYSCMVGEVATGCTMVFNYKTVEIIGNRMPLNYSMHDVLVYSVCKILGEAVYDSTPYIMYRQHQNNVLGMSMKKSRVKSYIKRLKRLFDSEKQPIYTNVCYFVDAYSTYLNSEDLKTMYIIADYKKGLVNRIRLLVNRSICSDDRRDDMRYRILVIFGKI